MKNNSSDAEAWTKADAKTVFFILDTQFGDQLLTLPITSPIWLANSELNTPAAKRLWRDGQPIDNLGLTTFTYLPSWDSADFFESMLITIHDHHGPSSHLGSYSTLVVIGLPFTTTIEEILANVNLQVSFVTKTGFIAKIID